MNKLLNQEKATYALLADNVYWDIRYGFEKDDLNNTKDFSKSNRTPVPDGGELLEYLHKSANKLLKL